MLLYPAAAIRFVNESGSCRTSSSRKTFLRTLGQLQGLHPLLDVDRFTTGHLTQYCLGMAPNTIKTRRSILRSFFDWACYQKLVKVNPASDLKFTVRTRAQGVRQHNWLSEVQVAHVLRSCPAGDAGRRARVILMAGFMMGLRREEISALRWSQFSADMGRLSFVGKGSKLDTIGVPSQFQAVLRDWKMVAPAGCDTVLPWVMGDRFGNSETLWSKPIKEGNVAVIVGQVSKQAGIRFLPHDMRRSFAGILEAKGVPITDISRLLRHANVGITSTYLEKNPARAADLAANFTLDL